YGFLVLDLRAVRVAVRERDVAQTRMAAREVGLPSGDPADLDVLAVHLGRLGGASGAEQKLRVPDTAGAVERRYRGEFGGDAQRRCERLVRLADAAFQMRQRTAQGLRDQFVFLVAGPGSQLERLGHELIAGWQGTQAEIQLGHVLAADRGVVPLLPTLERLAAPPEGARRLPEPTEHLQAGGHLMQNPAPQLRVVDQWFAMQFLAWEEVGEDHERGLVRVELVGDQRPLALVQVVVDN